MSEAKLKLTLATVLHVPDGRAIDAYKCVYSDNQIVIFLSVASIEKAYYISPKSLGEIRGVSVTDMQSFFDAVEDNQKRLPELFKILEDSLELTDEELAIQMPYQEFLSRVNFNQIPKRTHIKIYKNLRIALDESLYIERRAAELLIKKYGKQPKPVQSSKGFNS